ncbi:MAG: NAD(P)H-dependent amine dehydrogenase family protein [Planctomycetota bacterium]|jgi:4-hydroxy-tetrahydrodipicolinate reductase
MIDIIQVGIGPLGQKMVKSAVQRGSFRIVGAVDTDPAKVGQDLGTLCGIGALGVTVAASVEEALAGASAQVAVVTTVSSLEALEAQVAPLAKAKLHIVSTCEELSCPWRIQPAVAQRIDTICREHGVACVGTGINPGYLMDLLPTVLTTVCENVTGIRVSRVQDASVRRIPFQQKIGAGLTVVEFEAKREDGSLRHVGLPESVDFIAAQLGWTLDRKSESIDPVMADEAITTGYKPIDKGMCRGVHQVGRGFVGDDEVITLTFTAAVGEPESFEEVQIEGTPAFHSRIDGGIHGDIATCAVTLNTVRSILNAGAGLRTMADLPATSWFARADS